MQVQVDNSHYDFAKYLHSKRMMSYWHQIKECLALSPQSVLEIGCGDLVFGNYLMNNTSIEYKSADIDDSLKPDYLCSADALKLDKKFDMICAFQILEHIPFEKFEDCIASMAENANKYVLISLPYYGPYFKLSLRIPFLKEKSFLWKLKLPKEHVFDGEHYWEIGKKGFPVQKIHSAIEKHLDIEKAFVVPENPYHYFIICKKKYV